MPAYEPMEFRVDRYQAHDPTVDPQMNIRGFSHLISYRYPTWDPDEFPTLLYVMPEDLRDLAAAIEKTLIAIHMGRDQDNAGH